MDQIFLQQLIMTFQSITHMDDDVERRSARELQRVLGYSEWRNFCNAIDKAKESCISAGGELDDHFVDINKMVDLGSGGKRELEDYMLSRFACYLIAQNGDPKKQEIAFAQAYFALQTRKQELFEEYMVEHQRLMSRQKLKTTESEFQALAFQRGVDGTGIARIRSRADSILFGGRSTDDMKRIYGIVYGPLADHLPEVTIKAKDLATEITNYNMKQKDLLGEAHISSEHEKNIQGVRSYLVESGIKPEELPPAEDLKKIERKHSQSQKSLLKKGLKK